MHMSVTGAAGFLGSHLVDRLLADGDRVSVDNYLTGSPQNRAHRDGSASFAFVEDDVSQPWVWADAHDRADLIVHFASPAIPTDDGRASLATLRVKASYVASPLTTTRRNGSPHDSSIER